MYEIISMFMLHEIKYSGFLRRFGAFLIDIDIYFLAIYLIIKIGFISQTFGAFLFIFFPLYNVVCLRIYKMTLGKYILGIKLENERENKVSNIFVLFRREFVLKPISILFLGMGVWYMFFNSTKQTFYDKKLKVVVIVWRSQWIYILMIYIAFMSCLTALLLGDASYFIVPNY